MAAQRVVLKPREVEDLRLPVAVPVPAPTALPLSAARDPRTLDPRTLDPRESASSRLPEYIAQLERETIEKALQDSRYNKTRTAAALGITFRALRYKLKKLGID